MPPSSTHQYLPPLSRASLILAFWRCEGGSSPLNVIFGYDPHGPPCFTACQNKHHERILGCSTPKPRPSRPIGGGCSPRVRGYFGVKWPSRVRLATLHSTHPRSIWAQIVSKLDSHFSLARVQIKSYRYLFTLNTPIIYLPCHGHPLFWRGT